jgi:hypothetical protein
VLRQGVPSRLCLQGSAHGSPLMVVAVPRVRHSNPTSGPYRQTCLGPRTASIGVTWDAGRRLQGKAGSAKLQMPLTKGRGLQDCRISEFCFVSLIAVLSSTPGPTARIRMSEDIRCKFNSASQHTEDSSGQWTVQCTPYYSCNLQ